MNWTALESDDQLETISKESKTQPVIIFKHSTTCNISGMMLSRLERNWKPEQAGSAKPYLLDLRAHRGVSNSIASLFQVQHESPQMLIIRNGKSVNVMSHMEIDFDRMKEAIANER